MGELTLVLGGTRSGKSRYARERAIATGGALVTYVATARPGDPELDARIAAHRADRPPSWTTVEVKDDLAQTLHAVDPSHLVLLDSLTLWAAPLVEEGRDLVAAWDAAADVLARRAPPAIVVSDESGLGVTPLAPLARRYLDDLGRVQQRAAAQAAAVVLCVAGLPLALKGALPR